MKTLYPFAKFSLVAFILFVVLINGSCKKELLIGNELSKRFLTSDELRKSTNNLFDNSFHGNIFGDNRLTANWTKAYSINLKNGSNLIHVPLNDIYEDYNLAKTDLVAYKDSTNQIVAAIMVIRPADGVLKTIKNQFSLKNFKGDIILYSLDKKFMRGYSLINGLIVGEAKVEKLKENGKPTIQSNSSFPNKVEAWEERCEWRQGQNYVNTAGEVVVVARRFCSWHYKQPDPFMPEEETIDFIEPEPSYGGEIITEEKIEKIISKDTSILNSPKAKCALEKLLNNNVKFDSLLKAFTDDTYNLTFKVETMNNDTVRGRTTYEPAHPQNFQIILNRKFVNTSPPLHIAKTLLHEAFHANLMQRAYQVFGSAEIMSNWTKKPEEMALTELMDIFESKVAGTAFANIHHEYIARHMQVIVSGLKEFTQKNDSNYTIYDDYDFLGLAWEGIRETHYFRQNVQFTQIYYVPNTDIHVRADSLFDNRTIPMLNNSNVNCNP